MKNYKRFLRSIIAFLLVFSILFLSSCSLFSEIITASILEKKGYYTEYNLSGIYEDQYNPSFEEELLALLSSMEELVIQNKSEEGEKLLNLYEQFEKLFYQISDHTNYSYILFCQEPGNKQLFDEYNRLSSFGTDAISRLYLLYGKIHESTLSETFYKDWEKEDIEEALFLSKTYDGDFATITKQRDELVILYEQLDRNSSKFSKKSAEYYHQILSKNRTLASLAGAESYPDYADLRIYERDYTKEQISSFKSSVKEYLVPLANDLLKHLKGNVSFKLQNELSSLTNYDLSYDLMIQKLSPYYEALGTDYDEMFESFQNHLYTAKDNSSSPVAFTVYQQSQNTSLCYFGKGYQNLTTYVHEQGHYAAFFFSESALSSIDLCETHSQSNEWIYLAYCKDLYKESLYEDLVSYYLLNQLVSMILACCCDSFEREAYSDPSLTATDYDKLFIDCVKEFGAYDLLSEYLGNNLTTYWHHAVISNSMYYLSYAVSLVPAIECYLIAVGEGFDDAAAVYRSLCTVNSKSTFLETILNTSLSSPFEREIFTKIYNHFLTD